MHGKRQFSKVIQNLRNITKIQYLLCQYTLKKSLNIEVIILFPPLVCCCYKYFIPSAKALRHCNYIIFLTNYFLAVVNVNKLHDIQPNLVYSPYLLLKKGKKTYLLHSYSEL